VRIFGLTGGIASGKSTVARLLREHGAPIVDADALAREVVEAGSPGLAALVESFGPSILLPDGSLDRGALGAIAFASPEDRKKLEAITHPRIAAAGQEAMAALAEAGETLAFYEAALLVENNLQDALNGLIVVSVPVEIQIERLQARDTLNRDDALARLQAQLPLADKLAVADYVIDNSGSQAETAAQVAALWRSLQGVDHTTSK